MVIKKETIAKLKELYPVIWFYKDSKSWDECDPKDAGHVVILFDADGNYLGKRFNVPKNKEVTFDYVINVINKESSYKQFSDFFGKIIRKYGLSCYPTTYGIGIFIIFGHDLPTKIKKINEILEKMGVEYKNEYSDQRWVYRYKISKKSTNLQVIKNNLENDTIY